MDRGKAIEILESIKDGTACLMPNMPQIGNEAVDMAIEALKQPEIELLSDGTLMVQIPFDMTKVSRVNVHQIDTHYGDLFYPDED